MTVWLWLWLRPWIWFCVTSNVAGALAWGRLWRPVAKPGRRSYHHHHNRSKGQYCFFCGFSQLTDPRLKLWPTSGLLEDCGWVPSSPSEHFNTWGRGSEKNTIFLEDKLKVSLKTIWKLFKNSEDDLADMDVTVTTRPQQSEPMQMPGGTIINQRWLWWSWWW